MESILQSIEMGPLGELPRLLLFIGSGLLVYFYLQNLGNRQLWNMLELCLGAVVMLVIPFSGKFLGFYLVGDQDELSLYLFRLVLAAMSAQGAVVYLTQNSSDTTVTTAITISNILSRSLVLLCAVYASFHMNAFQPYALKGDYVFLTMLIIGDFANLSKLSTNEGKLNLGDRLSLYLTIDGISTFLFGSLLVGFPDMFLGILNPDMEIRDACLALAKSFGCMVMGGSLLSFSALCFKNRDDAVSALKSRLAVYIPALILAVMNYSNDQRFQTTGHCVLLVGVFGFLVANAGCAALHCGNEKKHE